MDEVETAGADPSTADPSVTSPATNAGQPAEENIPFHKHPRWQERTVEIQGLRQQNAQLNQRLQQLEARREQTGQPVSQEEQELKAQRTAAIKALNDLAPGVTDLPQIKALLTQQMQAAARANEGRARSHIAELAKTAGLSTDPKFLGRLVAVVAREAQASQDADARYDAGDFSHLTEAFEAIKSDFPSTQQRAGITALAASKNALSRLPSRPTGGVPGGVAFTKPVAGDQASQRTARRERNDAMSRMVDDLG